MNGMNNMMAPLSQMMNSPILQMANLVKSGQNPMGMIQMLSGQNPQIAQGLNLIQGKNAGQLQATALNLAKERGIDIDQLAQSLGLTLPR